MDLTELTMLRPKQLLNNLESFHNPASAYSIKSIWPRGRRSAVLILLFIGNHGEIRVLLTKRSRSLRSFSGHVSLPGGKADNDEETCEEIARREAFEEIGLPMDDQLLNDKFNMKLDRITTNLPCYMSRTFLSVKPVVYFLYNTEIVSKSRRHFSRDGSGNNRYSLPLDLTTFFGKLNPGETSCLFSIPINDLITFKLQDYKNTNIYKAEYAKKKNTMHEWGDMLWAVKHFYYPIENHNDIIWLSKMEDLSCSDDDSDAQYMSDGTNTNNIVKFPKFREVWGLTAKILTDVAIVANNLTFEEERSFGHEDLIYALHKWGGQFQPEGRSKWEIGLINNDLDYSYRDVLSDAYIKKLRENAYSF